MDIALVVRVIGVEAAALRVVGREGDREQAALAAEADQALMSRKGRRSSLAAAQDRDPARLLDHEEQLGEARRAGYIGRAVEVADLLQADAAAPVALPSVGRCALLCRAAGGQRDQR